MKVTLTRWERFKDARTVHNRFGSQSMATVAAAAGVGKGKIQALEKDDSDGGVDRGVDYREVAKLAAYYGVTSDWLMGLSPYRTPNVDAQTLSKRTGLSETAITNLINEVRDPRSRHLWNLLLGVLDADKLHRFSLAADRLVSYYENHAKIHFESKTLLEHIPEDKREEFQSYIQQWGGELIDPEEAAMVFAHEVEDALGKLLFSAGHKLPPSGTEENEISQLL